MARVVGVMVTCLSLKKGDQDWMMVHPWAMVVVTASSRAGGGGMGMAYSIITDLGTDNYYVYVCMQLLSLIDILNQGTWDLLKELEEPELKELAKRLPDTILHSRADSMEKKYLGAFKVGRAGLQSGR